MLVLDPALPLPLLILGFEVKFPWLLKPLWLVPLQRLPVVAALLVLVALMLPELLLGLQGFGAAV